MHFHLLCVYFNTTESLSQTCMNTTINSATTMYMYMYIDWWKKTTTDVYSNFRLWLDNAIISFNQWSGNTVYKISPAIYDSKTIKTNKQTFTNIYIYLDAIWLKGLMQLDTSRVKHLSLYIMYVTMTMIWKGVSVKVGSTCKCISVGVGVEAVSMCPSQASLTMVSTCLGGKHGLVSGRRGLIHYCAHLSSLTSLVRL